MNVDVIEVGSGSAVAVAGRLFADIGARVAKLAPAVDDRGGPWATALDEGKQIFAEDGVAFRERLAAARIVLLGDRDASFAGLDDVQPRAGQTVARVSAFDEPVPVDDLIVQAAGGVCAGIGEPGRPTLKLPLDQSAQQGGLVLAIAAASTLFGERAARIDVSAFDVWLSIYAGPGVANARFGRSKTRRAGHRALGFPWPRTILKCKDGYFAVQCSTRDQWRKFLALVGRPELESDPLFKDRVKANDEHGDEAEAVFADWLGGRTRAQLTSAFISGKIPGAPVYRIDEVAASEHLAHRGAIRAIGNERGRILAANLPYAVRNGDAGKPDGRRPSAPGSPLDGIRVLDFGWAWAGAVPGHILADLGAEVIKVETMTHLDYMRQGRPIVGTERDPEQNPMFAATNRGKCSLRIDITKPAGADVVRELAAASDVVIENFAPGVLDRHGLGWRDLSAVRPGLIMCSMSAAGTTGPLRDIRTYATMIAGLCGLDSMVGYPGERVLGSQSSYADPNASLHAVLAILTALLRRRDDGAGCWIDLSQWEAGVRTMGQALAQYSAGGTVPGPNGLARNDRFVHGAFPTAGDDRWIAISVREEEDWRLLCEVLGEPDWTRAVRFRPTRDADVEAKLAGETVRFEANDLAGRLASRRMAAPVLTQDQIAEHPGIAARGIFEDVESAVLGPISTYRLPWRLDGERIPVRRRAPVLGEHNDYVLRSILKLAEEKVAELERAEVFV